MTIGRTDDPESPSRVSAFKAARLFGTGSRNPSGPAVTVPRQQGRTHERNRPARQNFASALELKGPFSNRVSFVNSHLLSSVCLTGSRFSPRSEMSAATSGSKHRRCNVHNGLAHNQAAQRPLSQSSCTLAPWATHPVEAGWVLLGCLSQQPVVRTSEMPRPSARYCAGSQPAFWPVPHALCPGRIALRSPAPNPSGWRRA
jgi:hypothetical protein